MFTVGIRKDVVDFVKVSETILSSALLKPPLNDHERTLIGEYVRYLSDRKQPWNEPAFEKSA